MKEMSLLLLFYFIKSFFSYYVDLNVIETFPLRIKPAKHNISTDAGYNFYACFAVFFLINPNFKRKTKLKIFVATYEQCQSYEPVLGMAASKYIVILINCLFHSAFYVSVD